MARNKDKKKGFSLKEKLAHYTAVAKGEKPTKDGSKFTEAEQRAYARGQRDARNESRRVWKSKNSTEIEKQAYKDKKPPNVRHAKRQSKPQRTVNNMVGKYNGTLIGHSTYDKDGKTTHVYEVFCGGKKDKDTGLYTTECSIVRIRDEAELPNMAANMPVEFYG